MLFRMLRSGGGNRPRGPPASLKARGTPSVAVASFVLREICLFAGDGLCLVVFRVLARRRYGVERESQTSVGDRDLP